MSILLVVCLVLTLSIPYADFASAQTADLSSSVVTRVYDEVAREEETPFKISIETNADNKAVLSFSLKADLPSNASAKLYISEPNSKLPLCDEIITNENKALVIPDLAIGTEYTLQYSLTEGSIATSFWGTLSIYTKAANESEKRIEGTESKIAYYLSLNKSTYQAMDAIAKKLSEEDKDTLNQRMTDKTEAFSKSSDEIMPFATRFEVEPNDTLSSADIIYDDDTMYGQINPSGDSDYFKVQFPSNGNANFWLGDIPLPKDYDLYLYDAAGAFLASSTTSNDQEQIFNFPVTANTWYFMRVVGFGGAYDANAYYRVRAKNYPTQTDDHGDIFATATSIPVDTYISGVINYGGDNDYFRFTAPTTGVYTITSSSIIDTYGYLYNGSQVLIAEDDDSAGNSNFSISYYLTVGQLAYVRVRAFSGAATGAYSIRVTAPLNDDHGDTFATATSLFVDTNIMGVINYGGDNDYFRLLAPRTGTYIITSNSNIDTYGYLYNDSQILLAEDDDSGGNFNFRIAYNLLAGQFAYVRVRAFGGTVTGAYTLRVEAPTDAADAYEPNNTVQTATAISSSATLYGNIHNTSDIDFYKFDITGGAETTITLSGVPSGCNYEMELYQPQSGLYYLIADSKLTGTANEIIVKPVQSGTYYVRIYSSSGSSTTNYTLQVYTVAASLPLPRSNSEVPYEPQKWNYSPIQSQTNCYAYALNLQRHPITGDSFPLPGSPYLYIQPGQFSNVNVDLLTALADTTGKTFISLCTSDATAIGGTFQAVRRSDVCPTGTYKVALVLDPGNDYHWYRQNPDGTWSHKPGSTPVRDLDNANPGQIINDPLIANRSGGLNYYIFVGYFAVKPLPGGAPQAAGLSTDIGTVIELEVDKQNPAIALDRINSIQKDMSMEEVHEILGLPQNICGSGIPMDAYDLEDGTVMVINYGPKRDAVRRLFVTDVNGDRTFIIE